MANKKFKVYLAPSNQLANMYFGGSTNEAKVCQDIASRVERELIVNGIDVKVGKHAQSLLQKAQEAGKWGADVYVAIHSNGSSNGKARGTEAWYYTGSAKGKKLANAVYVTVEKLVGNGRGVKGNTAYLDLKQPAMPSTIIEIGFHDNKYDAEYITTHKKVIASAITEGICNYFGVGYKGTETAGTGTGADDLQPLFKAEIKTTLNLRTGPGTGYKNLGSCKAGTVQTVYDTNEDGTWGYNGKGWHSIKNDYVKRLK